MYLIQDFIERNKATNILRRMKQMEEIAVIVDSNSGITQKQGKQMGIFVLPMPFFINDEMFFEDITLTQEEFYKRLADNADIKTSQPSPGDLTALWDEVLQKYESIVHIPMSSGLSSSYQTAHMLAQDYEDRVQVVNNQRISVTQRQSVLDALDLIKKGKGAVEIKQILEKEALEASIYITVETLKYLKKGGRITPAAAAFGTILNIKPVLQIQGEKLDAYAKTRGKKQAKKIMLEAMRKDLDTRFKEYVSANKLCLMAAYAGNKEEAIQWKEEIEQVFPEYEIYMDPLSLSVACHIGEGALAIACAKRADS